MAKRKVIRGGQKILGALSSGTGDPILTKDTTTGEVGEVGAVDSSAFLPTTLANGTIYIGNASNIATSRAVTGDVLISNLGVTSIAPNTIVDADIFTAAGISYGKLNLANSIVNNDIATAANITRSKLAAGNVHRVLVNNASGVFSEAAAITASRVLLSDANGIPVASTVTTTQFGYYDPTSSIQTQLDNRLQFSSAITPAVGDLLQFVGGSWTNLSVGSAGYVLTSDGTNVAWAAGTSNGVPTGGTADQYLSKIDGADYNTQWTTLTLSKVTDVTATAAQVNALATGFYDATSSIQAQFGQKLSTSLSYNSLFVGNVSNTAGQLSAGTNGQVLMIVSGSPVWQTFTPGTGSVTSIDVSGSTTGLTFTGGPITTSGTITAGGTLVVSNGGTGRTTNTAYAIMAGGTTATGALQQVSGLGTSGQVLTSTGAGALPTWQTPSSGFTNPMTTLGDLIIASGGGTATRLAIGTSTYVLTSNGTTASWQPATGSITGTGAAGQVAYWTGTSVLTSEAAFAYDATNNILTTARLHLPGVAADPSGALTDGDIWYNSTTLDLYGRINGISSSLTRIIYEDVPGTTYTFVEADRNKFKRFTDPLGCLATIPVGLSNGWLTTAYRADGAGTLTFTSAGTYEGSGSSLNTAETGATIYHRGGNIHVVLGAVGSGGTGWGTSVDPSGVLTTDWSISGTANIDLVVDGDTTIGNTGSYLFIGNAGEIGLHSYANDLAIEADSGNINITAGLGNITISCDEITTISGAGANATITSLFQTGISNGQIDLFIQKNDLTADGNVNIQPGLASIRASDTSNIAEIILTAVSNRINFNASDFQLQGVSPASPSTMFFRGDGTWAVPAGGGSGDMLLGTAQTITAAKLFNTGTLGMRNPANTFTYNFLGSAIVANRNVTIPLLTANDTFTMDGFASTFTGVKTFNDGTLLLRNVANTFSSQFTNTNSAARTYTLPDFTGNIFTLGGTNPLVANTTITDSSESLSFQIGLGINNNPATIKFVAATNAYLSTKSAYGIQVNNTDGIILTTGGTDNAGDIWYRNSSSAMAPIAIGPTGTILMSGGTAPVYSAVTMPSTISPLSIFVADTGDTLVEITATANQSIRVNAGGTAWEAYTPGGGGGSGDVVGPGSSVNNSVAFFDGTTGKLIKDSGVTLSGTNTGDQTSVTGNAGTATALQNSRTIGIATGDVTSSGSAFNGTANNTNALTLATVNSNVGTFGSATQVGSFTVNAKGLITAASNITVTPAIGSITGLGTGVATWLATPSSSNLKAAVTDETGSGVLVFGTSPTFTTDITTPLIIGGTGTTSTLTYKTTSGVGATGADHIFQVGNNGGTEAMRILNNGNIGIGVSPSSSLHLRRSSVDAVMSVESVATGTESAITARTAAGYFAMEAFGSTYSVAALRNMGTFTTSSGMTGGMGFLTLTAAPIVFTVNTSTEAMRVTSGADVVIGVNSASAKLHVRGSGTTTGYNFLAENSSGTDRLAVRDNGAVEFSGTAGTSGQVLTSAGSSTPPTWTTISGITGLTSGRVPYATSSTTIGDEAGFEYDAANNRLTADTFRVGSTAVSGNKTIDTESSSTNATLSILPKGNGDILAVATTGGVSLFSGTNSVQVNNSLAALSAPVVALGNTNVLWYSSAIDTLQFAGTPTGSGNTIKARDGISGTVSGDQLTLKAGTGYAAAGNGNGGSILIQSGQRRVAGSGTDGNITIDTLTGYLIISTIPSSSAGLPSGAIWANSNVLTRVP